MQYNILGQSNMYDIPGAVSLDPDVISQTSTIYYPDPTPIDLPGSSSIPGGERVERELSVDRFEDTGMSLTEQQNLAVQLVINARKLNMNYDEAAQAVRVAEVNEIYSPQFIALLKSALKHEYESDNQALDADVVHTTSEILDEPLPDPNNVIQVAEGPGGPGGDLDLTIDPGSDVGQILDTLSRWGMVDTVIDANNHVSATLTEKGKTTLWGSAAAIGGLLLYRKFGAKKPRKRTYKSKSKKKKK